MLPVCQRYGMSVMVWSPLAMGMLTGRYRRAREVESRRTALIARQITDARRLEAVEQLIPLAEKAGLSLTHMAMAFAIAHPGVTSAIIGPRTMEPLLLTLAPSHYCERARWALDRQAIAYDEERLAPGDHILRVRRIGASSTSLPLLVLGDGSLCQEATESWTGLDCRAATRR